MQILKEYLTKNKISQAEFADMLKLKTQGAISQWIINNRIPALRVLQIEKLTNGKITRYEMRPDLYPREK